MRTPYPNELYHHGVIGMKWGVRRYQNADGTYTAAGRKRYGVSVQTNKAIRNAYISNASAREDKEIAKYHPNGVQVFGKTVISSEKLKQAAAASEKEANDAKKKAEDSRRADSDRRWAVKEYSKKMDRATNDQEAADEKWNEVKEARTKLGKNSFERIKNSNTKTAAGREYLSKWDEWEKLQDKADRSLVEAKDAYQITGRNHLERIVNNMKYDPIDWSLIKGRK